MNGFIAILHHTAGGLPSMRFFTHLISTAFDTLLRSILSAIISGVVAAGGFLLMESQVVHQWPPSLISEIAGGVIVVLAAYAGATTTILRGITKAVVDTEETVAKDVKKAA